MSRSEGSVIETSSVFMSRRCENHIRPSYASQFEHRDRRAYKTFAGNLKKFRPVSITLAR
jgi:hypothetical protein